MTAATAPTPGSARPARTNWAVALVLVGAGVAGALQIGKAVAALPAVRADLELSLVTAGWVLSLVNLAGALTGLLIGGRRPGRTPTRGAGRAGGGGGVRCGRCDRTRYTDAAGHPGRGGPRSRAGGIGRSRAAGPGHRRPRPRADVRHLGNLHAAGNRAGNAGHPGAAGPPGVAEQPPTCGRSRTARLAQLLPQPRLYPQRSHRRESEPRSQFPARSCSAVVTR
jgi:hypothetical protein